jgi:regulator of protease activity HflC (stomatin/prohibitin superfamily)
MKKLLLIALVFMLGACTRVGAGFVGVQVDNYGSDRGVQNKVLGPGSYFTGWNTTVYEYPTFTENYVYSKAPEEGHPADESITFQAKGGVAINADFGIAYHINPDNAPLVFQKYHKDLNGITDGPLRNLIRDSLNEVAGGMSFEDISNNIPEFMTKVNQELSKRAAPNGLSVELLSNVGAFRWPEAIQASINAQQQAKMDAITSQNQLQKTQADAAKRIANSDADLKIATNEAQATAIRGQALAKNPEVLQQMWIEKWNGQLPVYQLGGGSSTQIQLPAIK